MNYKQKLNYIKNFVFDIDGVLTNGLISVDSNGLESRNFNNLYLLVQHFCQF